MAPLSANVKLVLLLMTAVNLYAKDNPCVVTMVNRQLSIYKDKMDKLSINITIPS